MTHVLFVNLKMINLNRKKKITYTNGGNLEIYHSLNRGNLQLASGYRGDMNFKVQIGFILHLILPKSCP